MNAPFLKGQIKLKADWRAIDFLKKRTNKFVFFALQSGNILKLAIEITSFKHFQTVQKKQKQISSFIFWENLWRANLLSELSNLKKQAIFFKFSLVLMP